MGKIDGVLQNTGLLKSELIFDEDEIGFHYSVGAYVLAVLMAGFAVLVVAVFMLVLADAVHFMFSTPFYIMAGAVIVASLFLIIKVLRYRRLNKVYGYSHISEVRITVLTRNMLRFDLVCNNTDYHRIDVRKNWECDNFIKLLSDKGVALDLPTEIQIPQSYGDAQNSGVLRSNDFLTTELHYDAEYFCFDRNLGRLFLQSLLFLLVVASGLVGMLGRENHTKHYVILICFYLPMLLYVGYSFFLYARYRRINEMVYEYADVARVEVFTVHENLLKIIIYFTDHKHSEIRFSRRSNYRDFLSMLKTKGIEVSYPTK